MNSSVIVAICSVFGMTAMAIWGVVDKKVDDSPGATVTGALLFGSLFCGISGRWVPEGASLLLVAIFVWLLTLGSISFGRGSKV